MHLAEAGASSLTPAIFIEQVLTLIKIPESLFSHKKNEGSVAATTRMDLSTMLSEGSHSPKAVCWVMLCVRGIPEQATPLKHRADLQLPGAGAGEEWARSA